MHTANLDLRVHLRDERTGPGEVSGNNVIVTLFDAITVRGVGEKTTLGGSLGLPGSVLVGSALVHGRGDISPFGTALLVERKANQILAALDVWAEAIPGSLKRAHTSAVGLDKDIVDVGVDSAEEIGVAALVGVVDQNLVSARLGAKRLGQLAENANDLLLLRVIKVALDVDVEAVQTVRGDVGVDKVLGERRVALSIVAVSIVGKKLDSEGSDNLCAAGSKRRDVGVLERGEVLSRLVALGEHKRNVNAIGKIGQSILVDSLVAGNVSPGAEVGRSNLVAALLVVEDLLQLFAAGVGVGRRADGGRGGQCRGAQRKQGSNGKLHTAD